MSMPADCAAANGMHAPIYVEAAHTSANSIERARTGLPAQPPNAINETLFPMEADASFRMRTQA